MAAKKPDVMLLKQYQKTAVDFLSEHPRAILADEMGLGKTLTVLRTIEIEGFTRVLVICPKFAIGVWTYEVEKWQVPLWALQYTGSPVERAKMRKGAIYENFRIVITNVELVHELPVKGWDAIVIDEVHMKFRNRKNVAFKKVKPFAKETACLLLLTGSPIVRGIQDMWPYLNLLDSGAFKSFWRFVGEYAYVTQGYFGTSIDGFRNSKKYDGMIANYMLRRTKREAEPDLPPKTRQPIPLVMTHRQRRLYSEITSEILVELPESGRILPIPGVLARITRLRQLLVTPRLLGENEQGAALTALKEFRESTDEHLVIFTSFRQAIPHIQEALGTFGGVVQGGMTPEQISTVVQAFQSAPLHTNLSLIVMVQSAQSYTLSKAHTSVVIGPDWTTAVMEQAEDRLHRIGQQNPVHINYFIHKDTVEDKVLKALNRKAKNALEILTPEDFRGQVRSDLVDVLTYNPNV